jgi:hypothetical protein
MSTKFFCNSKDCPHGDKGPFVIELANEAVMDGNNLATIFCPKCGKSMKPMPQAPLKNADSHRFYCRNEACSQGDEPFFMDLPGEAVLDKNNIATIFCPKCGKEMDAFGQESDVVIK